MGSNPTLTANFQNSDFGRLLPRPAALLAKSRAQQKSFLFLLEEKIGRAQNKKCRENFFAGQRALASDGGAERQNSQSGFSSKKVRISSNKHHHLQYQRRRAWNFKLGILSLN